MTTTYIISFSLTTNADEHEAEALAAELADARAHIKDGERLDLAGVEATPPGAPVCGRVGRGRRPGRTVWRPALRRAR
jgi:hypothetical protein